MSNLIKKVQNFSHQNDLFKKKNKILVGVSGGADSVCLFSVLLELSKKYDFSLHVAHLNYGLRGKDSEKDEVFISKMAEKNGIETSVLRSKKLKSSANLEKKLRDIRYDFFEKTRRKLKFDLIAVAHNQDDQAETVLMRVLRGSGLQGLGSIRPKNGKIIRPLLKTSRKDILEYLKENNIKYRKDKTNNDTKYFRNRIRHKLMPYLEKNYNPSIKETLANFSQNVADDYNFILKGIKKECFFKKKRNDAVEVSVVRLESLHPSVVKNCLRAAIYEIKGNLFDIETGHLEELLKIIKSKKSKRQKTSFKGLSVERKGDILSLHNKK